MSFFCFNRHPLLKNNLHTEKNAQIPRVDSSMVPIAKCAHLCDHYPGSEINCHPNPKAPTCPPTTSTPSTSPNITAVLISNNLAKFTYYVQWLSIYTIRLSGPSDSVISYFPFWYLLVLFLLNLHWLRHLLSCWIEMMTVAVSSLYLISEENT